MLPADIASIAHEANRELRRLLDEEPGPTFAASPRDLRTSTITGVILAQDHDGLSPEEAHDAWCRTRTQQGWQWGEVKDNIAKTHPNLVPYDLLPPEQRLKDQLFLAIVKALT